MANIAILNYCNLKCPYCFANKFIEENEKQLIDFNQLQNIFDFLSRSKPRRIGLIGGEPTIHPHFAEILEKTIKFAGERKQRVVTFSNGIEIGEYSRLLLNSNSLININHPNAIGEANFNQLEFSLKKIKACGAMDNITIGINLYEDLIDFDYIFDIAKKYNKDFIRCSYVAPTCKYDTIDKNNYYIKAKNIFIPFMQKAKNNSIKVHLDCNNIPMCYFSQEEILEFNGVIQNWNNFCNPVIDISPDMKGTSCFGAYNLTDLTQFNNLEEAERYFLFNEIYPRTISNKSGKCEKCSKFLNFSCQGGCLAFSKIERGNG